MGKQKDEAGRQSTQLGRAHNRRTGWSEKGVAPDKTKLDRMQNTE